jgi:hypothetical protein
LVQPGEIALLPGIALKNLQAALSPRSFQRNHGIDTCSSGTFGTGMCIAPVADHLWGDFYAPDDVSMDSTTFTAPVTLGSLDYSAGSATSGNLWFVVGGAASTGVQEDVTSVLPIVGVEPAQEYWAYAQCVR